MLLDVDIGKALSSLPVLEQQLIALGSFAVLLIGVVAKVVIAFRQARKSAMDEQQKAFARDQEDAAAPKGLPPPSPDAVLPPPPPSREADVTGSYERIVTLEVTKARMTWDLEACRKRVGELEVSEREANSAAALAEQTLIDVRHQLTLAQRKLNALAAERETLRTRLDSYERADTDRPPPPKSTP